MANQSPFLGFDRLEVRQGSSPPLVMAGAVAALYFLRLEVDGPPPHPRGAIGDLFPVVPYPKTRPAGQSREEAEPCSERKKSRLILKVKETLLFRKLLRDQKVNDGKSTYPQASSGEFILAE